MHVTVPLCITMSAHVEVVMCKMPPIEPKDGQH